MSKKATDILAYCTWIGWLIAYLATAERENCKFHLNQGLALMIVEIAGGIIFSILSKIPLVGLIFVAVDCIFGVFCLILLIMGIIAAANGEEKQLPIIGAIKILK